MSKDGLFAILKNKKALQEVFTLGKQYDNETDPEKKLALKKEIDEKCAALKGKLHKFTTPTVDATAATTDAFEEDISES